VRELTLQNDVTNILGRGGCLVEEILVVSYLMFGICPFSMMWSLVLDVEIGSYFKVES
jgi:hypothetical protein